MLPHGCTCRPPPNQRGGNMKVDRKKRGRELNPVWAHGLQGGIGAKNLRAQEQSHSTRQTDESPEKPMINARIRYEDEDTGERRVVTLVYPDVADAASGRLSVLEPLGMALLGLREGESVDWPMQNGTRRRIRLVKVLPGDSRGKRAG